MSGVNEQHNLKTQIQKSSSSLRDAESMIKALEDDLKIEKEWRERLQANAMAEKDGQLQTKEELTFLKRMHQVHR